MLNSLLWWFSSRLRVREIRIEGELYLERYWLGSVGGWTFYLHRFLRPDAGRDLHDHPWPLAFGMVLWGGYWEERLAWLCPDNGPNVIQRAVRPWRPNLIRANDFHRITGIVEGTWTLFGHRPRCKGWGFVRSHATREFTVRGGGWHDHGTHVELDYSQHLPVHETADWQLDAPRARELRRAA